MPKAAFGKPLTGVSSGNRSRVSSVLTNNSTGEASQKYESGKWKDGIVSVPKAASQKSELGKLEGGMNCVCVTKVALGKPLRGLSSGIGNTQ